MDGDLRLPFALARGMSSSELVEAMMAMATRGRVEAWEKKAQRGAARRKLVRKRDQAWATPGLGGKEMLKNRFVVSLGADGMRKGKKLTPKTRGCL